MSWDQFCSDAKRLAHRAANSINRTADLAGLQLKLASAEHRLSVAYEDLGKAAYAHFQTTDTDTSAVLGSIRRVDECRREVELLRADVEAKKKENAGAKEKKDTQARPDDASTSDDTSSAEHADGN